MLLKCPQCGAKIRVSTLEFRAKDKLFRYLCQECEHIVMLDLVRDAIPTSSSSGMAEAVPHAYRVLVADDTITFTRLVEELLTREGIVVIIARDGVEALKKISEERPDAILLDLFMPNLSGFEVLKTLKTNAGYKNFRHIPVLVTSGVYKPAEVEIIHDLGASGFISKEAPPEMLLFRIKKLLSNGSREGAVAP